MHFLNNVNTIGKDFFTKPTDVGMIRLDYIYNKLHGVIPTIVNFSDKFKIDCVASIEQNFELLYSTIHKVGEMCMDEGVWVGKADTVYDNIFLSIQYRNEDVGSIFSEAFVLYNKKSKEKAHLVQTGYVIVRAACRERDQMKIVADLLSAHELKNQGSIYMLTNTYGDLTLSAMPLKKVTTDLSLNYGEEFNEVNNYIVESLNTKTSGLYLLHGIPGTGKSSYIKHLLSGIIDRKIAYVPVGLLNQLVSPDFLPLLMDNKDIILVIEDAEQALLSRETAGNAALVQTLLNLTDGIIGEALNISVIATFNTEREKLDTALLRKGRLKKSYEFHPLSKDNAIKLAESLGKVAANIDGPMTLADIYNLEEITGYSEPEQKRVGFF